jgi:hypothetical protein
VSSFLHGSKLQGRPSSWRVLGSLLSSRAASPPYIACRSRVIQLQMIFCRARRQRRGQGLQLPVEAAVGAAEGCGEAGWQGRQGSKQGSMTERDVTVGAALTLALPMPLPCLYPASALPCLCFALPCPSHKPGSRSGTNSGGVWLRRVSQSMPAKKGCPLSSPRSPAPADGAGSGGGCAAQKAGSDVAASCWLWCQPL